MKQAPLYTAPRGWRSSGLGGSGAPAPARPLSGVQPEVGVEVRRLVEALPADVAAEGLLSRVDAVVSLQHANGGETLATHRAAVGFLFGVPPHVDLQLAGKAEALPTLPAAVPPLDTRARRGGPRRHGPQAFHVLDLQQVGALFPALLLCPLLLLGCVGPGGGGGR